MSEKTQPLMRSQFILVYGPGSIIETENGPRLIPSLDIGLAGNFSDTAKKYEIYDIRMEHLINSIKGASENVHLFTLPSNASEGSNDSDRDGLYKTSIFPSWKICYNYSRHNFPGHEEYNNSAILYNPQKTEGKCPCCNKESNSNEGFNNNEESKSYVRFVLACPNGHLDDVDWNYAVHSNSDCKHSSYFIWNAKGGSLSNIEITCPKCWVSNTMENIQRKRFNCWTRLPEREQNKDSENVGYGQPLPDDARKSHEDDNKLCDSKMKIIQRQSTSLRVPLTKTLLTIPEYDTPLVNTIQSLNHGNRTAIKKIYTMIYEDNKTYHEAFSVHGDYITDEKALNYLNDDCYTFLEKAADIYDKEEEYLSLLDDEYNALSDKDQEPSENFLKGEPCEFDTNIFPEVFSFRVFPITKIRTITTQIGYQRFIRTKENINAEKPFKTRYIGVKSLNNKEFWYPAFEGIGEGIFITSDLNPLETFNLEKTVFDWNNVNSPLLSDISDDINKPLLVWWHTLSHAIIRQLGYMSGYSSASIRERIYATKDGKGGILLYNTSVGDDCGMGGLVDSVKNIKKIIEDAVINIRNCSNDPLCDLVRVKDSVNGAACINCLFLSETSCEFGNRLLDRHMILDIEK